MGHRSKAGAGRVERAGVFVRDRTGTHRDADVFSTDPGLSPVAMVEASTGGWNQETTFRELRAHRGVETTRGWCRRTVLQAASCLFGLDTVVALRDQSLPEAKRSGRAA